MKKKNVEIADIMLAAFLLAKRHSLVSHKVDSDGFVTFIFFDRQGTIEEDIQQHVSGKAKVISAEFVTAFRNLRSVIVRAKTENRKKER